MNKMFKDLPLGSPEKIIESVYDREERTDLYELERVLNKNITMDKFADSLSRDDELTRAIYIDRDQKDRVIFPLSKDSRINERYIGGIGDQDDLYHKENLTLNSKLLLHNLDESAERNRGLDRNGMQIISMFANEGRKYTAESKDLIEGDIPQLSYEGADELSAYMAARRFKEMGMEREDALEATAVIYNQENYRNNRNERLQDKSLFSNKESQTLGDEFKEKYGQRAENMLESLNSANIGCKSKAEIEHSLDKFRNGDKILNDDLAKRHNGILTKSVIEDQRPFNKVIEEKKKEEHIKEVDSPQKDLNKNYDGHEAIIRESQKREEELKRQRDYLKYKEMDDKINKTFLKSVDSAVSVNLMLGNVGSLSKKLSLEKIKDNIKGKEEGMER